MGRGNGKGGIQGFVYLFVSPTQLWFWHAFQDFFVVVLVFCGFWKKATTDGWDNIRGGDSGGG